MALSPTAALFLDAGEHSVAIEAGTVTALGRDARAPAGARLIDCRGAVIRPGAVNAHTHLYSGLGPLGLPAPESPPESFIEILERVWWRLDRALDRASLAASAELYVAEALLAGTTLLIDHHESPAFIEGSLDVLGETAQALGCRLATGYGATDRNGGADEGRRGLDECRRFAQENRRSLVRALVALHASFTVSDETVERAAALCVELGVSMHVHLAEDAADVVDAKRRGFAGPLQRLMQLGALPRGSILAHGVCLSEAEVRAADQAGLWLVQNPRSNAGNRVGFARALGASEHVALGTDGYPADMRDEQAALVDEAARAGQARAEGSVLARASSGYGLASQLFACPFRSEVALGSPADLVVWGSATEAASSHEKPRHVVVAGDVVVQDGRLTHGDIEAIRARAREQAPRLWQRMGALQ